MLATLLGFVIGIARLSTNWLVARLATVYVETIRNIPLLLQILFWYFAVLQALPQPRESLAVAGAGSSSTTAASTLPRPMFGAGFGWIVVALAGRRSSRRSLLARWARRRREATGQPFPTSGRRSRC